MLENGNTAVEEPAVSIRSNGITRIRAARTNVFDSNRNNRLANRVYLIYYYLLLNCAHDEYLLIG